MSHTKMLNRLYHNGQPTHAYENYSLKALIIAFLLYVSSVEIVVGGRKYCQYIRSSRHERTGNTFLTHDSRLTTDIREKCIAIDLLEVFANRDRCILGVYTNLQIGDRLYDLRKRIHHNLNHEMMVEEYSLVFTRGPSFCFFFAVLHYPSKEQSILWQIR